MRNFLIYYDDPTLQNPNIDAFEPLEIIITNDRGLPDTWTDFDHLDLEFSTKVKDFHPRYGKDKFSTFLVVPYYTVEWDYLKKDGEFKKIPIQEWHIEKVTDNMVDATEVQQAILDHKWKLGAALEWDLEGSVLNKVVIYQIPTYYNINV